MEYYVEVAWYPDSLAKNFDLGFNLDMIRSLKLSAYVEINFKSFGSGVDI